MKKPVKFLIITLLIVLGLFAVGILYLFFVPGSQLFKITYINNNNSITSSNYSAQSVNVVEINTETYNVNIFNTSDENFRAVLTANTFGFVTTSHKYVKLVEGYNESNKKLTLDVVQPKGLCTKGKSNITLYVPEGKSFDLILNNKSSNITTNLSSGSIGDLSYTSKSGSFKFTSGSVHGLIDLNLNKSKFTIASTVDCNFTDVKIKATSGRFNAGQSNFNKVEVLKNNRAIININSCNVFEMNCPTSGGKININTLTTSQTTAGDTKIYFKEITGEAIIDIRQSGSAHIENFKNEDSISILTVNSGKIKIDNCNSRINAYVKTGSLEINNARKIVFVDSENGNVSINFAEDAKSYAEDKNSRVIYANIKNGSFSATEVEHVGKYIDNSQDNSYINVTGNASVNINMKNVLGNNIVNAKNGSIKFIINADESVKYILNTECSKGSVRVNLSQTEQYNGYTTNEYKTTYVNCANSSNVLTINGQSASIRVFDTNFA